MMIIIEGLALDPAINGIVILCDDDVPDELFSAEQLIEAVTYMCPDTVFGCILEIADKNVNFTFLSVTSIFANGTPLAFFKI